MFEITIEAAVTGALITALVALVTSVQTRLTAHRNTYINIVTAERIRWIGQMRDDVATYCAMVYSVAEMDTYSSFERKDRFGEVQSIKKLSTSIKLRLNPKDKHDVATSEQIDAVFYRIQEVRYDTIFIDINNLVDRSQKMLKKEWDKVKLETIYGINANKELTRIKALINRKIDKSLFEPIYIAISKEDPA